ncbi:MAG: peptidylprolyl isomerase [Bradymonadaceae bacterium]
MVTIGRTTTALLATVALTLGAGCASSPEIPEEEKAGKKQSYRSTQEEDGSSSSDTQKTSGQSSGNAQTNTQGTAQPGPPQGKGSSSGKKPSGPPEATGPVATVDGDPIPAKAFNEEIKKISKTGKFPPALLHRFKGRLIDRLVDQRLIDNAINKSSVEVSKKEVDKKLEEVRSEFDKAQNKKQSSDRDQGKRGRPTSLEKLAQKYGISSDELRNSIRRSIAIEKMLMDKGVELPTDKEVRKFYDNNPDKFSKPEQVHVRHILIKVKPGSGDKKWKKAKKKIDKIHKKATKDGTDFAKLAKKKSDGLSAKKGGDIGFISQKQFDKNFTKAAFALQKGQVSKPVKTRYGWHVIKLIERRKPETVPFEKVKPKLTKQLKNKRIHAKLKSYLKELRKKAEIKKHPENVE